MGSPWQSESDAIDATLASDPAWGRDLASRIWGQTPPAAPPPAAPPGQPDHAAEIAASLANPAAPPPPPNANYRGSIFPFSRDAQGNLNWTDTGIPGVSPSGERGTLRLPFDFTAGVPGAIWDAFRLPGDVATGQQPTPYSGGPAQPDPALLARTFNAATMMTPAPVGRGALPEVPTARTLADIANTQYDAYRNSGVQVTGTGINRMLNDLNGTLRTNGFIVDPASELGGAIRDLGNGSSGPYTVSPGVYDAAGLDAARQRFSKIANSNGPQAEAARTALNAVDDYMTNLPMNPSHLAPGTTADAATAAIQNLQDARANYGAAKRSDALTGSLKDYANTGILDQAVARADANATGSANLDQMIRSRIVSFMSGPNAARRLAGFSDAEKDLLTQVAQGGTPTQKLIGGAQGLLGMGHGAGGASVTAGVGMVELLSHLYESQPELAAALTMGTAVANPVLKAIGGRLEGSGLRAVDEAVRSRSPLYQGQTTVGSPTPNPAPNWVGRTVPPSLLNQQPQAPQTTPPWSWPLNSSLDPNRA
jgi:hypothetical protein